MINISENLLKNERILWQGKPARSPYLWNSMPMVMFISLLLGFFVSMTLIAILDYNGFSFVDPVLVLTAVFSPYLICMLLGWILVESQYTSYEYFITNQRIISCWGIFHQNMIACPKSQIIETRITRSLSDRLSGQKNTGSICLTLNNIIPQIYSAGRYGSYPALIPMNIVFSNIENPQNVLQLLSNES